MRTGLRPALRLAGERLHAGLRHLVTGLQWVHDALPVDDVTAFGASVHQSFTCAFDALGEAADIVALQWGDNEGICEDCEILIATEGGLCSGCHDSRGERQDERAAS